MYALFRVPPFGPPRVRAVKKEQKHYHFDRSLVQEPSPRFENLVACHCLKLVHFEQDSKGRELELRYFRDVEGRETDFVILENGRPIRFIECKWGAAEIGRGLRYLKARFPGCEAVQLSAVGKKDYVTPDGIRACPALRLLRKLA